MLLEIRVDQEALGGLVGLFYLVDLQALVVLVYLQSHIRPAEHHKDLSSRFTTRLCLC